MYHHISVQMVIDCSNTNGCAGGSTVLAWQWMANSSGVVPMENYPPENDSPVSEACQPTIPIYLADGQTIQPPFYQPGPNVALNVVEPCFDDVCPGSPALEDQIIAYMNQTGIPLVAYVDASNWGTGAVSGQIFRASQCGSSGLKNSNSSHVVQVVGHGYEVATNTRFILIRNSWSMDWNEGGYIRLEYGKNTCGWTNYLVQVDLPPAMPPTPTPSPKNGPIIERGTPKKSQQGEEENTPAPSATRGGVPLPQCESMCTSSLISCWQDGTANCTTSTCFPSVLIACSSELGMCNSDSCHCPNATPQNVSADCAQACALIGDQCLQGCDAQCAGNPGCAQSCQIYCMSESTMCSTQCCVNPLPLTGAEEEQEPEEEAAEEEDATEELSESIFDRSPSDDQVQVLDRNPVTVFDSLYIPLPQCESTCTANLISCWTTSTASCAMLQCWEEAVTSCSSSLYSCNAGTCGCPPSTATNVSAECSQACALISNKCNAGCISTCGGDQLCIQLCPTICSMNQCYAECCANPNAQLTGAIDAFDSVPALPMTPAAEEEPQQDSLFVVPQCEETCNLQQAECYQTGVLQCRTPACFASPLP